jgi:adenylate cyclase
MSTRCLKCGFNNPPEMRFCGNCGARLEGTGAATLDGSVPESLGVLVGSDLLARFQQAGLEAVGQRRPVTVLFADLVGYSHLSKQVDSEDLYEVLQQYIEMLATAVYHYEGVVDKILGDGLMALFGAPIAHENNAERALRAAMDMQQGLARLNQDIGKRLGLELQMRIGLNAGSVIVGGFGSNMLMDYTAIGDTVNMAFRLEEATVPGTIIVSERIYRQTRMIFNFEVKPSVSLKGVSQPVDAYLLVGLNVKPGSLRGLEGLHAPMVGRERELQRLEDAVQSLSRHKQGGFMLVTGEAGIGKSRLVAEMKAQVRDFDLDILEGQSLTYRRNVAYWIVLTVLRRFFGVSGNTPEEALRGRLASKTRQFLEERTSEVLPYLENLFSLRPSDPQAVERIAYQDANQVRQYTFIAVRDLLVASALQRPLLLMLDDLHWADDASLDLLQFLLGSVRQAPLLVCGITRPYEGRTLAKIVTRAEQRLGDRFNIIQLKSLPPEQSEELLYQLLSTPKLPLELRDQIIQRAAGVPFYLEEILRMLIDQQVIQRSHIGWELHPEADLKSLGVPDNLQSLILARFDRLDQDKRRILQIASVIGHQFGLAFLRAVLPTALEQGLPEQLSHLVERAFIQPEANGEAVAYTFRHVLTSDAIYSTLLRRERAELHGKVGEAIETLFTDRLEEFTDLLARHYSWSLHHDRAFRYVLLGGQKAARDYNNSQAREYFEQALEILPQVEHDLEADVEVRKGLGDVLVFIGEYETARTHYQNALDIIEGEGLSFGEERCALHRKISGTYERQGEYDQALFQLVTARCILDDAIKPVPVERAKIFNDMGWIHFRRGDIEKAEAHLNEALKLIEGGAHYDVIASVYNRLGGVHFSKEELDQASNFVRKSLVLREEMGDLGAVARSYNNLGLLGWKRGDWAAALDNFKRSLEAHNRIGDIEGMIELHGNLGLLQLDRGNIEDAKKHLSTSLSTAQEIGHTYIEAITYWYLSHLYILTEEWGTALDYANRGLMILEEIGAHEPLVDVYTNIGLARLGLGDLKLAEDWARKALDLGKRLSDEAGSHKTEYFGRVFRLLGEISQIKDDGVGAERFLKESESVFAVVGSQVEQGRTIVARARLAASRGDRIGARMLLNEARLIFNQLGAQLDLRKIEVVSSSLDTP